MHGTYVASRKWLLWTLAMVTIMAQAQTLGSVTPLRARGYTVLPTPQQAELADGEAILDASWHVVLQDVKPDDIAVVTLRQTLRQEQGFDLKVTKGTGKPVRLAVAAGTIKTGLDAERDKQAYLLEITAEGVEITGNSPQGLFYGVQTLLQLLKRDRLGRLTLPIGVIRDWPQYQLRICHWDTKHHQDRVETLKRYLDWCARFKVNAIVFELEDKFEYPTHPIIGAPGAFTTEQLQDLVNYGLERYIQIIPNIQAPAHLAYVLKHEQFAHLRSDGSNYMANFALPETYKLIFEMYQDVINATKGVDYFFVSTDEVYYAGISPEAQKIRPYNPENRSLWWVEFVRKAHDFLAERGRRMLLWVEYPLLPEHVHMLPADVIDGIVGNEDYVETEKKLGIRTLAYAPIQGAEKLFPNYFDWKDKRGREHPGRLRDVYETPIRGRATKVNPIGTFAAAWDDAGLHNETFWLGWAAMAAYGWHPGGASIEQVVTEFMEIYYGPDCTGLVDAYRDLQMGARFWEQAWSRVPSKERPPAYGNSRGKRPIRRTDLLLHLPELPQLPDLKIAPTFKKNYVKLIERAREQAIRNERLRYTLQAHLRKAQRNRYGIEVLLALADFQRHQIDLILGLQRVEADLLGAARAHKAGKADQAIGLLVQAHEAASRLVEDFDLTYRRLKATFEKSRYPKGRSVGGKKFVHIMDDVKDHFADRRPDLSFMIAPEQRANLPQWVSDLGRIIREYAKVQKLDIKALPDPVLED